MKVNQLRKITSQQLKLELLGLLKESFNLRIQKVSGRLSKPHLLRCIRRNIARVQTVLRENEILKNGK